jgi:hypothetical protein
MVSSVTSAPIQTWPPCDESSSPQLVHCSMGSSAKSSPSIFCFFYLRDVSDDIASELRLGPGTEADER